MIQRVFGVLAALAIVGGSAACSSSSPTNPVVTVDSGTDTKKPDTGPAGETGGDGAVAVICAPAAGANTDCTTGKTCTSNDTCDLTGNGFSHCTATGTYIVGPLNPTPICTQFDTSGADVCDPGAIDPATGDQTQIVGCDGNTGLCMETPTNKKAGAATCDPMCEMDDTGKFTTTCAGKNACSPSGLGTDATTMKKFAIGTCQGGCSANADCPTGSVCDPLEKICTNVKCTADAACKTAWSTGPAAWKCDLGATSATKGFCTFQYAKNPGDVCNPAATVQECLCIATTGVTQGVCSALCTTGHAGDCATGSVCDPLWNSTDSTGAAVFPATFAWPAGVAGYCVSTCTADADCKASQKCTVHGGMGTQKSCL
jgi:hypothetical protein